MSPSAEVLFTADQIARRVAVLGARISADYEGREIAALGVLKGSFIFMADLVRAITRPVRCGFLDMSPSPRSGAITEMVFTSSFPVEGTDLLLVEDILDTGVTLAYLVEQLELRGPRSIKVAVLLDKPSRRRVAMQADYVGFEVPDRFVVGYGLDRSEAHRNLPFLGTVP
jgi:hypoxanthine phosphoribosyltransferase